MLDLRTREDYVHFVEVLYFGAMAAGRHADVLGYFAPGAMLTGYAGEAPVRILTREPGPGQSSLDAFMAASARYDLAYSDFVHYVDMACMRVATHFTLSLRPKSGGGEVLPARRMKNCNFFQFRDSLLVAVTAHFSNPGASA